MEILRRVLNLKAEEGLEVLKAWALRFFNRVGFVMGWTILVAMFVSNYGIGALPYLLILNALFTFLGSLIYAILLRSFRRDKVLLITVLAAAASLLLARCLYEVSLVWFFALMIVVVAVFVMQIRILSGGSIEEMFTASQSGRIFPLVEAADTLGGILAGLLLIGLADFVMGVNFLFLWIFALLALLFLLLFGGFKKSEVERATNILSRFREATVGKKQMSFLKILVAIVFLQWLLFNLLEFQYTVAVFENASEAVLEGGSGFEHAFIHDLGVVFVLFSFCALLVQVLVGSRIISHLGVVGTLLLHALVAFVSAVGLLFSFSFSMAVFSRNNFTMTSVLHLNAYHSSFYGFRQSLREDAREFLDGVVRPLGALFGTMLILALKLFLSLDAVLTAVSWLFLVAAMLMFYFVTKKRKVYTAVAIEALQTGGLEGRLNAVDVLMQKGHSGAKRALKDVLSDRSAPKELREKIKSVIVAA